ncbi:sigma-70 family RNA polymerase sigma factor [Actinoplanes subtropicus]|uniref:sigma-70 family RNA polymerase sigma factor n=1 Tax=Actinoplanes subtropicus TaxID=543632 RepID=UPI0004C42901|nr:sigma-70 family RNA polymerase sigma factor [Actinoplanes subtropicus]
MEIDFPAHREHLYAVARHMLGSPSEADDAVQEAWLRLATADTGDVRNVRAWLTTVVARICLDMLRARRARREVPMVAPPPGDEPDPQDDVVRAEAVGVALLVTLDMLTPAERLAFVLHDVFAVPFEEIAEILGRSTAAAKMLASRARRRVRAAGSPDGLPSRRTVVEAFLAAARDGDFARLLDLLDPDVTARADAYAAPDAAATLLRGAQTVARQALTFAHRAGHARVALVDGAPAILVEPHGRLVTAMTFTVEGGRVRAIDIVADPGALARLRPHVQSSDLWH